MKLTWKTMQRLMQKDVILCLLNVQESFDPKRPWAHARKKALEFSGCHVWVSITLRPSFPAGTARSQLPMGIRRARHALPKRATSAQCANIFASVGVQQKTHASEEVSFFRLWGRTQESLKMWSIQMWQSAVKIVAVLCRLERFCVELGFFLELSYSHN